MGWYVTLGILAMLAILPLGVSVRYDSEGVLLRLIAGPVKLSLFPRPKKDTTKRKEKKPKNNKTRNKTANATPADPANSAQPVNKTPDVSGEPNQNGQGSDKNQKKKTGGSITDFLPLVGRLFDFLGDFRRKLRVNVLELKVILAGDDPCDLAVNYGRAWAAVGNLLPRLERYLVIQKRDINVECDFTASNTTVIARMDLTITLGRLLAAVFTFAFHAVIEFLKIMKKRKGGAENEPKSS